MKKFLISLVFFLLLAGTVSAQFATCDLCGYCPPAKAPSNWESCRSCIYPLASSDPSSMSTLRVDTATDQAPTPQPGKQFTLLGCIGTNMSSFASTGGTTSVIQSLLSVVFSVAGGIAFLYILYGSTVVLSSRGNIERLNHGRRLLYGAIVGLIFCFMSLFIIQFIGTQILQIPGFGK